MGNYASSIAASSGDDIHGITSTKTDDVNVASVETKGREAKGARAAAAGVNGATQHVRRASTAEGLFPFEEGSTHGGKSD
jgi:hypothetical protein